MCGSSPTIARDLTRRFGMRPPAEFFKRSGRAAPTRGTEPLYPLCDDVRKVTRCGSLRFGGRTQRYFLSTALAGERVGLRELTADHWLVCFADRELAIIDRKQRRLIEPPFPKEIT